MFEYLMPALWMHSQPDTIIDQTQRAAFVVSKPTRGKKNVPWAFRKRLSANEIRRESTDIGLLECRGWRWTPHAADNLVVSPYASFLALLVEADAPIRNLEAMRKMGCLGSMGFYESCDFTPVHIPEDADVEIIRCWMAHHQGMSLVALCNFLNKFSIQKWFHKEPRVVAAELFLHERVGLCTPLKTDITRSGKTGRTGTNLHKIKSRTRHHSPLPRGDWPTEEVG